MPRRAAAAVLLAAPLLLLLVAAPPRGAGASASAARLNFGGLAAAAFALADEDPQAFRDEGERVCLLQRASGPAYVRSGPPGSAFWQPDASGEPPRARPAPWPRPSEGEGLAWPPPPLGRRAGGDADAGLVAAGPLQASGPSDLWHRWSPQLLETDTGAPARSWHAARDLQPPTEGAAADVPPTRDREAPEPWRRPEPPGASAPQPWEGPELRQDAPRPAPRPGSTAESWRTRVEPEERRFYLPGPAGGTASDEGALGKAPRPFGGAEAADAEAPHAMHDGMSLLAVLAAAAGLGAAAPPVPPSPVEQSAERGVAEVVEPWRRHAAAAAAWPVLAEERQQVTEAVPSLNGAVDAPHSAASLQGGAPPSDGRPGAAQAEPWRNPAAPPAEAAPQPGEAWRSREPKAGVGAPLETPRHAMALATAPDESWQLEGGAGASPQLGAWARAGGSALAAVPLAAPPPPPSGSAEPVWRGGAPPASGAALGAEPVYWRHGAGGPAVSLAQPPRLQAASEPRLRASYGLDPNEVGAPSKAPTAPDSGEPPKVATGHTPDEEARGRNLQQSQQLKQIENLESENTRLKREVNRLGGMENSTLEPHEVRRLLIMLAVVGSLVIAGVAILAFEAYRFSRLKTKDLDGDGDVDFADFRIHLNRKLCCGISATMIQRYIILIIITFGGFALLWYLDIIQSFMKQMMVFVYLALVFVAFLAVLMGELWSDLEAMQRDVMKVVKRIEEFVGAGAQVVGFVGRRDRGSALSPDG